MQGTNPEHTVNFSKFSRLLKEKRHLKDVIVEVTEILQGQHGPTYIHDRALEALKDIQWSDSWSDL